MQRLRRSALATPGSNERMIAKAAASDADEVFLDLEDAVAPAERAAARVLVVDGLTSLDWGHKTRAVRVNSLASPEGVQDLETVIEGAGAHVDAVIIPKVRSADEVHLADRMLDDMETRLGLKNRIGIEVLIETVEALVRVHEIAGSSSRIETLIVGVGDLGASQGARTVGLEPSAFMDSGMWLYARSRILVAARNAGVEAIDGPFTRIPDLDAYERLVREVRIMGFSGKWAIHPSQIPVANRGFGLQPEEQQWLSRIEEEYLPAVESGVGAIALDGELVDAAHLLMAERLRRLDAMSARSDERTGRSQ